MFLHLLIYLYPVIQEHVCLTQKMGSCRHVHNKNYTWGLGQTEGNLIVPHRQNKWQKEEVLFYKKRIQVANKGTG